MKSFGDKAEVHQFVTGEHVDFTDYTEVPDQLEALFEQGRLVGALTLYKLTGDQPGRWQLGMINGGLTVEATFDLICLLRRSMMKTLGFMDLAAPSITEDRQDRAEVLGWLWCAGEDCPAGYVPGAWRFVYGEREARFKAYDTRGSVMPVLRAAAVAVTEPPEPMTGVDAPPS